MKRLVLIVVVVGLSACGKVVTGDDDVTPDADPCAAPNVCECTVATEDTDCGAHEFCNDAGPGRACECVAGYTGGVGGCVFTGTINDPGFAASDVWTPVAGALLNTTAAGDVDPGEAAFLPSTLCDLGRVEQTVDMPTFAKAEPLVLELTYKNQQDFNNFDSVATGVSFGGVGWFSLPSFGDALFHSVRICLSAGGYAPAGTTGAGAPVTFMVGPYTPPRNCPNSTISNFSFDHFNLVKANAGECGDQFGQGPNFDAESTGGWTFTTSGNSSGGFVNGLGEGGTKAARVNLNQRCEGALMETNFNVPDIDNPALDMFVGLNANAAGSMTAGTGSFGGGLWNIQAPAGGTSTKMHMCLPPSLRGQISNLRFSLNSGSGSCADVLNFQIFADNVQVVDDPACNTADGVPDPGFESGNLPLGAFGFHSSSTADAVIRSVAGKAHSGTHYLALESHGRCSSSGYTLVPIVPPPSGANGPALTFFANVGTNPDASTSVFTTGSSLTLPEGGGYMKQTVCLNPKFVGRPQVVTISHSGGSGLCDNSNYTQQDALIDDVAVTTDPSCPAQ